MKTDQHGRTLPRIMYWPPWDVTDPWKPKLFRGGDEWGRPSICFGLPFTGVVTVFHGPPVEPCHCGRPPFDPYQEGDLTWLDDWSPAWGVLCQDCATVRCDINPGACK